MERRETLLDLFDSFRDREEPFLVSYDGLRIRRFTYRQTAQAAQAFAQRLTEAGVSKGDKVLLWSENRAEWVAAFWGTLLAEAVLVPVDYRASYELVERIQAQVQARVILIGDRVAWPGHGAAAPWRLSEMDWREARSSAPFSAPAGIVKDDLVEIIFTSGTTGDPKGVLITHRNILANLVPVEQEILKYRGWGRPFFPLRFLNLLPLSHMFGQAMSMFIPPMLPGVTVFIESQNPAEIARQVRQQRVSVIVAVPQMLEILKNYVLSLHSELAERPAKEGPWWRRWWRYRRVHRLFGWKFWAFVVGAAPLQVELEEFWRGLGFVVVQGYGLTETAPIVTLNHPFHTRPGSVGKPIAGVEVKLASDGEILVRGDNVTQGYFGQQFRAEFEDGWLHTGDIGEMDAEGQFIIRGRKKDVIVTSSGMNVFPEDVEQALMHIPGVRDAAVVGPDQVHAVLVLAPDTDATQVVRQANQRLEAHQYIRNVSLWPDGELPRAEGTGKLKRRLVAEWVHSGGTKSPARAAHPLETVLVQYAGGQAVHSDTKLNELALSSLDRVDLMVKLGISESRFQQARTVADLEDVRVPVESAPPGPARDEIPQWPRSAWARAIRDASLATWILPLAHLFVRLRVTGLEHLKELQPPVIFAANHQSHLDAPAILSALPFRWRRRVAIAASKEFFSPYFHPEQHGLVRRLGSGLAYFLGSLIFHAFPLPQREAGTMVALQHAGRLVSDGWCVLIFPEGERTNAGEIHSFLPGVGMMASRLGVPVVPVRLEGLEKILHKRWKMAHPGRASIRFGSPLQLQGDNYAALARKVEEAVREL